MRWQPAATGTRRARETVCGARGDGGVRPRTGGRMNMATDAEKILEALATGKLDIDTIDPLAVQGNLATARQAQTADTAVTREQRRSRRKRAVRARTISVKRMTKRELELGKLLYPEVEVEKPKQRVECVSGERPCPFVSCKHHLYLDVSAKTGAIKLNFPDLEVW